MSLWSCLPVVVFASLTLGGVEPASPRAQPVPVALDSFRSLRVSTAGQVIHDADFRGFGSRSCLNDASHTDPTFSATQWTAQAGFVQNEVAAATYTLPASAFPIKIETLKCLFVTSNTIVQTTTEWSVLVWDGTPTSGTLVAEYSSDGLILPHLIMPPGNNGTLIELSVDPGDPEQIYITNAHGTNKFTIGFRIDKHNSQSGACSTPASNRNAFPATDRDGLAASGANWLYAITCPFACPGGWHTFSQLDLVCRPTGDWAMAATWSKVGCVEGFGACCLPDGSCEMMFVDNCIAAGGTYRGDGVNCSGANCPTPTGACCFPSGFCLVLSQADCTGAGGTYAGHGTTCADNNGNSQPDACESAPCIADRNGDGQLNFFDVQHFLNNYSALNASADMNSDGQINFFDVQIYLNLFAAGCP